MTHRPKAFVVSFLGLTLAIGGRLSARALLRLLRAKKHEPAETQRAHGVELSEACDAFNNAFELFTIWEQSPPLITVADVMGILPELVWQRFMSARTARYIEAHLHHYCVADGCLWLRVEEQERAAYLDGKPIVRAPGGRSHALR